MKPWSIAGNYNISNSLKFSTLLPKVCHKKQENQAAIFIEVGWISASASTEAVGWAKRSVPIMSGATKRIDGHGLSAFAHPTLTFSLQPWVAGIARVSAFPFIGVRHVVIVAPQPCHRTSLNTCKEQISRCNR